MFSDLVPAFTNVDNVARKADVEKRYWIDADRNLHDVGRVSAGCNTLPLGADPMDVLTGAVDSDGAASEIPSPG